MKHETHELASRPSACGLDAACDVLMIIYDLAMTLTSCLILFFNLLA